MVGISPACEGRNSFKITSPFKKKKTRHQKGIAFWATNAVTLQQAFDAGHHGTRTEELSYSPAHHAKLLIVQKIRIVNGGD